MTLAERVWKEVQKAHKAMLKDPFTKEHGFYTNSDFVSVVGKTYPTQTRTSIPLLGLSGPDGQRRRIPRAEKNPYFARILCSPLDYDLDGFIKDLGPAHVSNKQEDAEIARMTKDPLAVLQIMDLISEGIGRNNPHYNIRIGNAPMRVVHKPSQKVLYIFEEPRTKKEVLKSNIHNYTLFLSYINDFAIMGKEFYKGEQLPVHMKDVLGRVFQEKYCKRPTARAPESPHSN